MALHRELTQIFLPVAWGAGGQGPEQPTPGLAQPLEGQWPRHMEGAENARRCPLELPDIVGSEGRAGAGLILPLRVEMELEKQGFVSFFLFLIWRPWCWTPD